MAKKYGKNIIKAVDVITKYVNMPVQNKKISFLFGAGINNNVSKNKMEWKDLALKSIKKYIKTRKRYSKYELDIISKSIIDSFPNLKFPLSFDDAPLELDIEPLPAKEIEWFIDGYNKIMTKMDGDVTIFTLNYDLVLERILKRTSSNFLEETPTNEKDKIIHLHGVINKKNGISNKALLTLKNYVDYSREMEDDLKKYLKPGEDNIVETIVIIGSMVQEEHLLRTFKEFKKQGTHLKNIILIAHQPNDLFLFERIKKIYEVLDIKILNINCGHSYKSDFKSFWQLLSENIMNNNFNTGFDLVSNRKDVIDNDLYFKIKSFLKNGEKEITLEEFFKKINWKEKNNKVLIRPIYWLEKNDRILKAGSLKYFMLNILDEVPLDWIHMIEKDKMTKQEVNVILSAANKAAEHFTDFGYDPYQYEIESFVSQKVDIHLLKKYKNLMNHFYKRIFQRFNKLPDDIKNKILKSTSYSEINHIYLSEINFNSYPDKNSDLYSLFKLDFENNINPLGIKPIPNDKRKILRYIKEEIDSKRKYEILTLFLFKPFEDMIIKNKEYLLQFLDKENFEKNESFVLYRLHSIMYFVLMKSKYESWYLEKMKDINCVFETYPQSINLLGHGGTDVPKYTKYDGENINNKKITIKNWTELIVIMEQNEISYKSRNSVIEFINDQEDKFLALSKLIKNDIFLKKIKGWGWFEKLEKINIECSSIEEYKKYIKIIDYETMANLSFLNIKAPFNIWNRVSELTTYIMGNYDKTKHSELLNLIEIKDTQGSYNKKSLWWNQEIKVVSLLFNKLKEKSRKVLNPIFFKVFEWKEDYFISLINGKEKPKTFEEFEFSIIFSNNLEKATLKQVLNFFDESCEEINDSFFEIADFIIRMQKNRNKWNNDFGGLVKFIEKNKRKFQKEQESIVKKWLKTYNSKIAFNVIVNDSEQTNKLTVEEITMAVCNIEDPKKYDQKISLLLDRYKGFSPKEDRFFNIRRLNFKKLGKLTISWYFDYFISGLKTLDKNKEYYDYNFPKKEILDFRKNINIKQKRILEKTLKDIKNIKELL